MSAVRKEKCFQVLGERSEGTGRVKSRAPLAGD